ncbi:VOC family protein [Teichococcus aestuarii]|uniref:VOC family protein n=1 Tax=Teichococcus aestuarii TaxID=568898 RepID=UPI00360A01BE
MTACRIDHLHLRSPDPEAAARFYVSALDARETGRQDVNGALRIMLDLGGLMLFIEAVPPETPKPPPAPFQGIEHIGLTVPDLDAAIAELAGKGVPLTSGPREVRPGLRIAFIDAPDKVRIELLERRG